MWQRMDTNISKTAAQIPPELRGKRLYFEVSRGPYAAGASSFIGELITRMGLGNIVDKNMGPFPKLNPEFIVLKNPDFILAGDRSAGEMQLYPGWKNLPAVKNEQFCLFTLEQMDVLIHPGPRMDESAQILRDCVLGKLKVQSRRKPQPANKPGMS
jgi:iron complex transport system substrate-binding protein